MGLVVTGICNPSSWILWISNPIAYPIAELFYNLKNGSQILRIQEGGIKNKSHQPSRTICLLNHVYISMWTGDDLPNYANPIRGTYQPHIHFNLSPLVNMAVCFVAINKLSFTCVNI